MKRIMNLKYCLIGLILFHVGGVSALFAQASPVSATSSNRLTVLPGFEAKLFVAEPALVNPIHWTWDHKGRLWVVESVDYPNVIKKANPVQGGNDRIKIFEDTNGDNVADVVKTFAENLNIPVGIALTETGVVVNVTGAIYHIEDTDGDDKADKYTALYTNFTVDDTHLQENSVQYGLDNRYWVSQGGWSGTQGAQIDHGAFTFAIGDPSIEHFVYETSGAENRWGIAFTETGDAFMNGANGAPVWNYPIPYKNYVAASRPYKTSSLGSWGSTRTASGIKVWNGGFRNSSTYTNMSTAMGISAYTARLFPQTYHNRAVFLPNPGSGAVHRRYLTPNKSTFSTIASNESLVYSADPWFSPLRAETGPDGAVWIMDWCDVNIGHFEGRDGAPNGLNQIGKASPITRDKAHGRIYRIVPTGATNTDPIPDLKKDDVPQLVRTLRHDNRFWRLTAQRLLTYQKAKKQEVVDLILPTLTYSNRTGETENFGTIHALWTLHGLNAIVGNESAIYPMLRHPSDAVVQNVLQVLPKNQATADAIKNARVLEDSNPHVRLKALLALSEMPASVSGTLNMRAGDKTLDQFAIDGVAMAGAKVTIGTANNGGNRTSNLSLEPAPPVDFSSASIFSKGAFSDVAPVLHVRSSEVTGASFGSLDKGIISFYSLNGELLGTRTLGNQRFAEGPLVLNSNLSFYQLKGSFAQITGKIIRVP